MPDDRFACNGDGPAPPSAETPDAACLPPEVLDLRHLPAPLPLERGLAAAEALAPGAPLVLLTPMLPVPLLQLLEIRGFQVQAWASGVGVITRQPSITSAPKITGMPSRDSPTARRCTALRISKTDVPPMM